MRYSYGYEKRKSVRTIMRNGTVIGRVPMNRKGILTTNPATGRKIEIMGPTWYREIRTGEYKINDSGRLIKQTLLERLKQEKNLTIRRKPNISREKILTTPSDSLEREVWREDVVAFYNRSNYVKKVVKVTWGLEMNHINNRFNHEYLVFLPKNYKTKNGKNQVLEILRLMGDYDQYHHWINREVVDYEIRTPTVEDLDFGDVKLRLSKMTYPELGSSTDAMSKFPGYCMLVGLLETVCAVKGYKNVTMTTLIGYCEQLMIDYKNGITPTELKTLVKTFFPQISLKAFDPLGDPVEAGTLHVKPNLGSMHYLINDKHCYPNLNKSMKASSAQSGKIKMTKVSMNYNFDKAIFLRDEMEIEELLRLTESDGKKVYLIEKPLKNLVMKVALYTYTYPTQMAFDNHGYVKWFVHPLTNCLFVYSPQYSAVEFACKRLYDHSPLEAFKFKGQSLVSLSNALYVDTHQETIPQCYLNEDLRELLPKFYTRAINYCSEHITGQETDLVSIDCKQAYDATVESFDEAIPHPTLFDKLELYDGGPIPVGIYLLKPHQITKNIHQPAMFFTQTYVREALKRGVIKKSDIVLQMVTYHKLTPKKIQEHLATIKELFSRETKGLERDVSKNMSRHFYGGLGAYSTTKCEGFMTCDEETINQMMDKYANDPLKNLCKSKLDDHPIWFGTLKTHTVKTRSSWNIYCHILSCSMMRMFDALDSFTDESSDVIAIKTDAIILRNPTCLPDESDNRYRVEPIKKMYKTEFHSYDPPSSVKDYSFEWNDIPNAYVDNSGQFVCDKPREWFRKNSCLIRGVAGCGKSVFLKAISEPSDLNVATKQTAVANLKASGIDACTIDHAIIQSLFEKASVINVDECGELPMRHVEYFNELKERRPDVIIHFYGDYNQAKPVEQRNYFVKYLNEYAFAKLCGFNKMDKLFLPEFSRYNVTLYNQLDTFLTEGKVDPSWERDGEVDLVLAFTNERVKAENDKILPGTPGDTEARAKWYLGQRILSKENAKGIANSRMYVIEEFVMKDDKPKLRVKDYHTNKSVPGLHSIYSFVRAFCITIHRSQCMTLHCNFKIVEMHKLLTRHDLLYTALSRAKSPSQIHIEPGFTDTQFIFLPPSPYISGTEVVKGALYIETHDEAKKTYVGIVNDLDKRSIETRHTEHITEEQKFIECGVDGWKVSLIGHVNYVLVLDWKKLSNLEKEWIRRTQENHEYTIINEQGIEKPKKAPIFNASKMKLVNAEQFKLTKWLPRDVPSQNSYFVDSHGAYPAKRVRYGKRRTKEQARAIAYEYHEWMENRERERLFKPFLERNGIDIEEDEPDEPQESISPRINKLKIPLRPRK